MYRDGFLIRCGNGGYEPQVRREADCGTTFGVHMD
jgi:hypothetical protein